MSTSEPEPDTVRLRRRLDALDDEDAIRRLLIAYFRGIEAKRSDEDWLASVFADDVALRLPTGTHEGRAGLGDFTRASIGLWDRSLHTLSEHLIDLAGDDAATVAAVVAATYVHRAGDPGAHLRLGGYLEAGAVRTAAGWRLARLSIRAVWTEGAPATRP